MIMTHMTIPFGVVIPEMQMYIVCFPKAFQHTET